MSNKSDKKQKAQEIINILAKAGYPTMLVGGCVRDELLGLGVHDYDLASSALPDAVQKIFNSPDLKNWKAIPSGLEHGTITLVTQEEKFTFEVTSLRQDINCDGRHAQVHFGQSFFEDSKRRDFTINALYQDALGHIYDFHNGLADIDAAKLRFIGESNKRIEEDYLRLLRYFRFLAKFQFKANFDDLKVIKRYAPDLKKLSQERITQELIKILSCSKIAHIATIMEQCGIFSFLFPQERFYKFAQLPHESLDLFNSYFKNKNLAKEDLALLRLTLLLNPRDNSCRFEQAGVLNLFLRQLQSLRLSTKQINFIEALCLGYHHFLKLNETSKTSAILLFSESLEKKAQSQNFFEDIFYSFMKNILNYADNAANHLKTLEFILSQEREFAWRKKSMPIDGHRLQELMNIPAGPNLGSLLTKLRIKYLDGEWTTLEELKRHI